MCLRRPEGGDGASWAQLLFTHEPRKSLLSTPTTTNIPPLILFHAECMQQVMCSIRLWKKKNLSLVKYNGVILTGTGATSLFRAYFWGAGMLGGKARCPTPLSKVSACSLEEHKIGSFLIWTESQSKCFSVALEKQTETDPCCMFMHFICPSANSNPTTFYIFAQVALLLCFEILLPVTSMCSIKLKMSSCRMCEEFVLSGSTK